MVIVASDVSVELSPGSNIRICPWAKDFDYTVLDETKSPLTSVRDLFKRSKEAHPDNQCFGWRPSTTSPFKWWNYDYAGTCIDCCRQALSKFGLEKGDRIGIYGKNCPQWAVMQYAALSGGFVCVPIYDTLGPDIVEYVCNHADVKMVFVTASNFPKLQSVRSEGKIPSVERVVVITEGDIVEDSEVEEIAKAEGVQSMIEFFNVGREAAMNHEFPEPDLSLDDILVIMYTSGTTGNPKGVVLTHGCFVASVTSAILFFKKWGTAYEPGDSLLSYLPLSHIFEQQTEALLISIGGKIGYYSGDIKLLMSDMDELKPTLFVGVPRVFARFQQRIEDNVESAMFLKRKLFRAAYDRQVRAEEHPGTVSRLRLWDALVFNAVRSKILPRCKLVITGSAPMSAQTNDYLKVCLNCPVVQGYGLTETVGGMNCSIPGSSKSGTCGGPLPGVQVKLSDLPEMGYSQSDKPYPRGEVCIKGEIVFKGYFKNEGATADAFDEDGFFKTGDVGQWLEDGSLQIIDRAKNLFKLSQGEYVSPEMLEQEYSKAKLILQIFVYGNSLRDHLVAVIVPDKEPSLAWGADHGLNDLESIVGSEDYKKAVLQQLDELRAKFQFKKYEGIKDAIFEVTGLNELGQGFHVDNNLLTPSFKMKRPQLKAKYGERLDALYEK